MSNPKLTYSDAKYWDQIWKDNNIFFHQTTKHHFLVKHIKKIIQNEKKEKIFFPFCGKEVDMAWLASLGHEIVGVEFVQAACEQFFQENNLKYSVTDIKDFKVFTSEDKKIKIYNGDFFKFTHEYEGLFECIWDRGSLGSLPPDLRIKYADQMKLLLKPQIKYLLDVYDYNPRLYPGPPHSVKKEELENLFGTNFKLELIENEMHQRFSDGSGFYENLYFLTKIN